MTSLVRSDWEATITFEGFGAFERRLEVTPAVAGWEWLSFRSYTFRAGQHLDGESADDEMTMVLLSGAITMQISGPSGDQTWELDGRDSVFDGPPVAIYLPPHHLYSTTIHRDADCCYGRAPAVGALPARMIRPSDLTTATDASGTRITPIFRPGETEHLVCQETVIAPGQWSTVPTGNRPSREAVAYFRTDPADGWGLQRLGGSPEDETLLVQFGDAVALRADDAPVVAAPSTRLYALSYAAVD